MIVSDKLQAYLDEHLAGTNAVLTQVERKTYLNEMQAHMVSGLHQGLLLKMLVMTKSAKRVLEIGTFTGFSAIAMAEGLPEDGYLITLEKDPEMSFKAQSNFNLAPHGDKITLFTGDAFVLLPDLLSKHHFDLVFVDADKSRNMDYYELLVTSLLPGSIILIDNVLWKGKVYDPLISDNTTMGFRKLNDTITHDSRVNACILPVRDGIWFIQKK